MKHNIDELRRHREKVVMDRLREIRRKHREEFSERVRELKERGFSMKEIARELDLSMHTVSSLWQESERESD